MQTTILRMRACAAIGRLMYGFEIHPLNESTSRRRLASIRHAHATQRPIKVAEKSKQSGLEEKGVIRSKPKTKLRPAGVFQTGLRRGAKLRVRTC